MGFMAFLRLSKEGRPRPSAGYAIPAVVACCAGSLLLAGLTVTRARTADARDVPGEPPNHSTQAVANSRIAVKEMPKGERLREGTEIVDQPGVFRGTGDRIAFFTDLGSGRFVVLENLALERVALAIEDNPTPLHWLVTGIITEYRGENCLLIRRAVLRTHAAE